MDLVKAALRDASAKPKRLRREGIVPGVLFGGGMETPLNIQLTAENAYRLLRTKRVGSLVDVELAPDGTKHRALIRELDFSGRTEEITHVSFQKLESGRRVNSSCDVVLVNKEKVQGILQRMTMRILYAAEPEDLFDAVTVNLENRPVGTVIRVKDLPEFQNDRIRLRTDPETVVLRIAGKRQALLRTEG